MAKKLIIRKNLKGSDINRASAALVITEGMEPWKLEIMQTTEWMLPACSGQLSMLVNKVLFLVMSPSI